MTSGKLSVIIGVTEGDSYPELSEKQIVVIYSITEYYFSISQELTSGKLSVIIGVTEGDSYPEFIIDTLILVLC